MYDKLFVDVCGMFNPLHYFSVFIFFAALAVTLFLSRKLTAEKIRKMIPWIAVVVSICEIVKIVSRIQQGQSPDSWVPLYYCSLYIYAIWMSQTKWPAVCRAGLAYMTMGGIIASIFFVFYPSTSLGMYPFLHPSSIHSLLYHLVMCYTGIILLWKGVYIPAKNDSIHYFVFVFCACIAAAIMNELIGTNCMFLKHPFGLPVLQPILERSKALYMLIAAAGQAVFMFWLNYGVYSALNSKRRTHTIVS